jgi:hypothetical protein
MVRSCHRFLYYNNTTKENDGTLSLSFSSKTQKRKNTKKNKKKKPRDAKELTFKLPLCPFTFGSRYAFSLLAPASAFLFLHFYFKCFFLASSSFQVEKKKNYRKEKICRRRKELTFKLSLCPFTFGSRFCTFVSSVFSLHLLLLKHKEKKNHREKKNAEKGGSLPSSSRSALSFLALASTLSFQAVFLGIFFFSKIRGKKTQKKK